jgi:hypothetical protein
MKIKSFVLIIFLLSFTYCSKDSDKDPNVIGGDTNVGMGTVGNEFSTYIKVNNTSYDLGESLVVTKNEGGIVTIDATADLSKIPALDNLIPDEMKDSNGKLKAQFKYKITSEGIQDFYNNSSKPFTIAKYDCKVGDEYNFTRSDGKKVTRKVTAKSTVDDFAYGFYYIKTIDVEQNSNMPGVERIEYKLNHKFGLVYIAIIFEDGTEIDFNIFSLY